MKKEYDFSEAEQGKFIKKNISLNLPVYLEKKALSFVRKIAERKKTDVSTVVNDLIKEDIKLAEYMK